MISGIRKSRSYLIPTVLLLFACCSLCFGQQAVFLGYDSTLAKDLGPSPLSILGKTPTDLKAFDTPNDAGRSITVTWPTISDNPDWVSYVLLVSDSIEGPFYTAGTLPSGGKIMRDDPKRFGWYADSTRHYLHVDSYKVNPDSTSRLTSETPYYFKIQIVGKGDTLGVAGVSATAIAKENWFDWSKLNNMVLGLLFSVLILVMISQARKRPDMYIRRVAGLDALDDALGRATEMGKAVYFIHGLTGMDNISTIASVNILGQVAKRVAEFDSTLKVMNNEPIVMAVSRETVREGYLEAGRPDAYNEDDVMFISTEQFAYAAGVDGLIMREKPAAILLMGYFYAESLIFAETGAHVGAIQIAATDSFTQMPFFVTVCDYTIMGEELYAASAYLSREPKLLGSVKGQDIGKSVLIAVLVVGTALATFGFDFLTLLFTKL